MSLAFLEWVKKIWPETSPIHLFGVTLTAEGPSSAVHVELLPGPRQLSRCLWLWWCPAPGGSAWSCCGQQRHLLSPPRAVCLSAASPPSQPSSGRSSVSTWRETTKWEVWTGACTRIHFSYNIWYMYIAVNSTDFQSAVRHDLETHIEKSAWVAGNVMAEAPRQWY